MGRKVTAIHLDIRHGRVSMRALAKSPRGSQYTLRAVQPVPLPKDREARQAVIESQLAKLLG